MGFSSVVGNGHRAVAFRDTNWSEDPRRHGSGGENPLRDGIF